MKSDCKTNLDLNRNKCEELLLEAKSYHAINDYDSTEKLLLKICRIAENVYRKTFLNKDSVMLVNYYLEIIEFYNQRENSNLVQRWHQKLVGILQLSCESRFVLDDYRNLMIWYVKTLDLMLANKDYESLTKMAKNMVDKSYVLFSKTKTNEDFKYYIIARLMLATGYSKTKHLFKSYFNYRYAANKLHKLYVNNKDEGVKNDLISIYECLYELSNRNIFKPIAKRWKVKILLLKEE